MRAGGTFSALWHVPGTWVVLLELCQQVWAILAILIALSSIWLQCTSGAVQRVTKAVVFTGLKGLFAENRRTGYRRLVLQRVGFSKWIISLEWIVADVAVEVQSTELTQRIPVYPP